MTLNYFRINLKYLRAATSMTKSGLKTRVWLLELVHCGASFKTIQLETRAQTYSDAKFYIFNKIAYLFQLPTA
jgi:hypothetical protein